MTVFCLLIAATFRRGAAAAEDDRVDPHELNLFAHSYFYSKSIIIYHQFSPRTNISPSFVLTDERLGNCFEIEI